MKMEVQEQGQNSDLPAIGMARRSKRKIIGSLLLVSIFGMVAFYRSCMTNNVTCPHSPYLKHKSVGLWITKVISENTIMDNSKNVVASRNIKNNLGQWYFVVNKQKSVKTMGRVPQGIGRTEKQPEGATIVNLNSSFRGHTSSGKSNNYYLNTLLPVNDTLAYNKMQQENVPTTARPLNGEKMNRNPPQFVRNENRKPANQASNVISSEVKFTTYTNDYTAEPGILVFRKLSCAPLHPSALLYNRIFKTGSTSVSDYMKTISQYLEYIVDIGTTEDWYQTGESYPYPDIIERHIERQPTRMAFIAHFFFRHSLNITRPFTYINIVREPIERIVSHYRYMRTEMRPTHRIIEMKRAGQWNESLLNCVLQEHRGCESNVMTRFFCGTRKYCKLGTKKALKLAKLNIKHFYAAVGLQQNITLFLQMLKTRLPQFFNYQNIPLPHSKQNKNNYLENKNNYLENIPESIIDIIRKRNSADIKLYNFVKNRFWKQMKKCGKIGVT